jgi:hypothetical protein
MNRRLNEVLSEAVNSPAAAPEWTDELLREISSHAEVDGRIQELRQRISHLEQEIQVEEQRKREAFDKWTGLLRLDGTGLEASVRDALELLGFAIAPGDAGNENDCVARLGNRVFLVQAVGSAGAVPVEHGRRLLHWIADAEDLESTRGLLIGNAFLAEAPRNRPPEGFAPELERMAIKHHFALLDTRQLFRVVARRLQAKPVSSEMILHELSVDGPVTFHLA